MSIIYFRFHQSQIQIIYTELIELIAIDLAEPRSLEIYKQNKTSHQEIYYTLIPHNWQIE